MYMPTLTKKHKPKTRKRKTSRPSSKETHQKTHRPLHRGGKRVYYQDLRKYASHVFRKPGVGCLSHFTTSMSVMAKTPREKAFYCRGIVRLGRNGQTLYYSTMKAKRNPRRYSNPLGPKYHREFKWVIVYDKTTGKPFDAKTLRPWQRAFLF